MTSRASRARLWAALLVWIGGAAHAGAAHAGGSADAAPVDAARAEAIAERCLLRELTQADDDVTVGDLRRQCAREAEDRVNSLLPARLRRDQVAEELSSILTPYKRNYLLPVSFVASPNEEPFADPLGVVAPADRQQQVEAKFQLSLKFSLADSIVNRRDRLHFGFTALSFWQAYNRNVSAPFRETNYEPELFWSTPFDWSPFGFDAGLLTLGVSHQSNGRGGDLSRSWNRVYANLLFEKDNLLVGLKPWWRIPEDEKEGPDDAAGDDNPDIDKYLGHVELTTAYRSAGHTWSLMLRGNTGSGKGAVQLEWAFPLWRGVRGYAQYFDGYGESLIDYDAHIERIGVGILLTDLF